MATQHDPHALSAKPGAWAELALTLPVFLAYQLGVVFLHVRNATDLVTGQLLRISGGDLGAYLGLTVGIGLALFVVFAVLGRGQTLSGRKILQIMVEGAAYAIAMSTATSWVVGKLFAVVPALAAQTPAAAAGGPLTGLIMSFGAGFYEELAFRAVLFGLGAKLLVGLFAHQRVGLVGDTPRPSLSAVLIMAAWAIVCAAIFSGMHYVGALGDPFDVRSFVARAVLGLALTLVYAMRGFAAAVWTHALYDIWVLVL
jgi:Type II CAAX prenyl endopeptidase Rce1-like